MSDEAGSSKSEDWHKDEVKACAYWLGEIQRSEKAFKTWNDRCDKIVKRYRDERDRAKEGARKFNILWSNIATLKPAIYSRLPKPVIERRFLERNDAERVAGMALERATSVELETGGFDDAIGGKQSAVIDYLLCSRGQVWIRYEADIEEQDPIEQSDNDQEEAGEAIEQAETSLPKVTSERLCVDYLQRKDFIHDPARTWTEVRWVAKRAWLTPQEAEKKFGPEKAEKVVYTEIEPKSENQDEHDRKPKEKRGQFWQIWDKTHRLVWVVCPDVSDTIFKKEEDPLELKGFFPCPRPLYGTMTPDTLVPVPDYIEYQDQAEELDELSERLALVIKAIQVRGAYDASSSELRSLLDDRMENKLVPVENWAAMGEKGGLEKLVGFLPLDMLIAVYQALEDCFEKKLQRLYEITGIADIIRGNSDPDETATAVKTKGNFATLRLKDRQKDVAVFCRDIIRIMVELIASKFSGETIAAMTGLADQNSQDAQFFESAMQIVSDARLRSFRVDVENQSTVELDAAQTQAAATEFLTACGEFINGVGQAAQQMPTIRPLLGQMLLWGVRQFRTGREIESAFEQFVDQLTAQAKDPNQQTPLDPKLLEVQQKAHQAQQEMQMKGAEMQHEQGMEGQRFQFERLQHQDDIELERKKFEFEMELKKMELQVKLQLEQAKHQAEQQRLDRESSHSMQMAEHAHGLEREKHQFEMQAREKDRESNVMVERERMKHDGEHRDKDRKQSESLEREKMKQGGKAA